MPTTPTNLNEYYSGKGQSIPNLQDRASLAGKAGITDYKGTAEQNTKLLGYLQNPPTEKTPVTPPLPPPQEPQKHVDQDVEKLNNQGKPGYDVLGNPIPGYKAPTTPTPTVPEKLTTNETELATKQTEYETAQKTFSDAVTNIQNGTTPLSAGEQAQIDGLKAQYNQLIEEQKLINKGAEGSANIRGYQQGAAEYDPTFQAKTIGSVMTAGMNKIADLNIKMASAVASLTQGFHTNDIAAIKTAWDAYQSVAKDRITSLQNTVKDTQTAIQKAKDDLYTQITKPIADIALDAKKNGADNKTIKAIQSATTVADAVNQAGDYLLTMSGDYAGYPAYMRDTKSKGLVPLSPTEWKDTQDKKASQNKINEAYATQTAKNLADANSTASDKVQQKLEQQYRQVLSKEFSARTGALGVENAKVNQANHLNSLFTQYYDPKTGKYNIPTAQYAELAIGLANMIAPTGSSSDADRAEIKSHTLSGDLRGALQYITGIPQNGNTQAIIKNLIDSIDRQAETASRNRETALQNMRDQAPTDLEQSRIDKLNKSTEMVKYDGANRIAKSSVNNYIKNNPKEAEAVAKLYEVPGATDQDIEEYLKAQDKIQ